MPYLLCENCVDFPDVLIFITMSIIDTIIGDIHKKVAYYSDWHVEISVNANNKIATDIYSWNAESPIAAKAIKEYLVSMGMTDGALAEPQGSFISIAKKKQKS